MGCTASKEAYVVKARHDGQRLPRLKINLDYVPEVDVRDLHQLLQENIKLGGNGNTAAAVAVAGGKEMAPSSSTAPSPSPAGSNLSHTPAVTPQASWTADSRRSSRTTLGSARGYSGGDGSSRRREGSRRRGFSSRPSSSGTAASRDDGGGVGWETEHESGTVGDGGREDAGTPTEAQVLHVPKQRLSSDHKRRSSEDADEATDADASWPAYPPILLVLHLFLETHRPSDVPALPGGGRGGGGDRTDPSPLRRIRLSGGLAYEGQLRRRHRESKEQRDERHHAAGEQGPAPRRGSGEGERRPRTGRRVPHGWGRLAFPDGAFYEGTWRGGVVHGKGALHLPNGNAYLGSWARGRKHGQGSFVWADGSRHEGAYEDGERSGRGKISYASGAVFEGDFKGGVRHGVGRLELEGEGGGRSGGGKASYDGEWVNDVPHGFGVFVSPAGGGERFEGSWRNGVRSGNGTLVQRWAPEEEEEKREGEEEKGQKKEENGAEEGDGGVGKEKVGAQEGDASSEVALYSGSFEDGLPDGDGMMRYGSATFCGHVEKGEWNGGGRFDFGENGKGSFEGTWHDGLPSGSGRWRGREKGGEVDCTFEEGCSQ